MFSLPASVNHEKPAANKRRPGQPACPRCRPLGTRRAAARAGSAPGHRPARHRGKRSGTVPPENRETGKRSGLAEKVCRKPSRNPPDTPVFFWATYCHPARKPDNFPAPANAGKPGLARRPPFAIFVFTKTGGGSALSIRASSMAHVSGSPPRQRPRRKLACTLSKAFP